MSKFINDNIEWVSIAMLGGIPAGCAGGAVSFGLAYQIDPGWLFALAAAGSLTGYVTVVAVIKAIDAVLFAVENKRPRR